MSLEQAQAIGATVTINKTLSEADIALFLLVTNETTPSGDEPPLTSYHAREAAPLVMLAALLASAAAGHARRPDAARFLSQTIVRSEKKNICRRCGRKRAAEWCEP